MVIRDTIGSFREVQFIQFYSKKYILSVKDTFHYQQSFQIWKNKLLKREDTITHNRAAVTSSHLFFSNFYSFAYSSCIQYCYGKRDMPKWEPKYAQNNGSGNSSIYFMERWGTHGKRTAVEILSICTNAEKVVRQLLQ